MLVLGNRGASGIEGIVSTAFGVASARSGVTVCVLGDLALFHDQNGLLWSREPDAPVVFVLVDNDGGGIFHALPIADHEPDFTTYFATPHGLDLGHAAAQHGIGLDDVPMTGLRAALEAAIRAGRTTILRVTSERVANRRRHAEVVAAVGRAVREVLTPTTRETQPR
jgi:2-succinyl-5-enolpyruvyl-6-hydroxy-3-cyclohexene-1-carboxylate synthase